MNIWEKVKSFSVLSFSLLFISVVIAVAMVAFWPRMLRPEFGLWLWVLFIIFIGLLASGEMLGKKLNQRIDFAVGLLCFWIVLGLLPTIFAFTRCSDASEPSSPHEIFGPAVLSKNVDQNGTQTVRYSVGIQFMCETAAGLPGLVTVLPVFASMIINVIPLGVLVDSNLRKKVLAIPPQYKPYSRCNIGRPEDS